MIALLYVLFNRVGLCSRYGSNYKDGGPMTTAPFLFPMESHSIIKTKILQMLFVAEPNFVEKE